MDLLRAAASTGTSSTCKAGQGVTEKRGETWQGGAETRDTKTYPLPPALFDCAPAVAVRFPSVRPEHGGALFAALFVRFHRLCLYLELWLTHIRSVLLNSRWL